jgi:uncharacterized protein
MMKLRASAASIIFDRFLSLVPWDDLSPQSDVDVLVEFQPGHAAGLDFFSMEAELTRMLGSKVDLNTRSWLSRCIRDRALTEAEVVYVAP